MSTAIIERTPQWKIVWCKGYTGQPYRPPLGTLQKKLDALNEDDSRFIADAVKFMRPSTARWHGINGGYIDSDGYTWMLGLDLELPNGSGVLLLIAGKMLGHHARERHCAILHEMETPDIDVAQLDKMLHRLAVLIDET